MSKPPPPPKGTQQKQNVSHLARQKYRRARRTTKQNVDRAMTSLQASQTGMNNWKLFIARIDRAPEERLHFDETGRKIKYVTTAGD